MLSERDGSITVSGTTGGSGNYTYELWEVGGAQIYGAQTSTTFTGLDAREYKVKIVDGWNCDLTIPVTIDEPQEIKSNGFDSKSNDLLTNTGNDTSNGYGR